MSKLQKRTETGDRLQTYPKGSFEIMEAEDNPTMTLLSMAITSLSGRTPKYSNDQTGLQLFQERTVQYFQHLKTANENSNTVLLPDIESWATFLQITRATIWNYRHRGNDWTEFIDRVKTAILAQRKDAATRFKTPPMVYVFDAVNNFGYQNTNQVQLVTDPKTDEAAELEDQIEGNGLVWDESSGQYIPAEGGIDVNGTAD